MIRPLTLSGFARDNRGVAAIEFAFVAPILIVFYLGMAEACQLLIAKRRVDHAGAAIADLVTQEQVVSKAKLTDLKKISATILAPLSNAADVFTVDLASVRADSSGALKNVWCWPTACAPDSTPAFTVGTPLTAGESVVVARVSYSYTSGIGYFITSGKTLSHKAELRPRKNDLILCGDCT